MTLAGPFRLFTVRASVVTLGIVMLSGRDGHKRLTPAFATALVRHEIA